MNQIVNSSKVAVAHDAMADEYDAVLDSWYTYLFYQIHSFILDNISNLSDQVPRVALDVGCGTGFQSFLLAEAGFDVFAFDLSSKLISKSKDKLSSWPNWSGDSEFDENMREFHSKARILRGNRPRGKITFWEGSALDKSNYIPEKYGIVNCCGSVLSFLEDPILALHLMSSSLVKEGKMFLEVEMKTNLDLIWPIIDKFLIGYLKYDQSLYKSISNLLKLPFGNIETIYPFELSDGKCLELPMTLFSFNRLLIYFKKCNFILSKNQSIHSVTNIYPSTLLHADHNIKSKFVDLLYKLDARYNKTWPFNRMGCSGLFMLTKKLSTSKK
jgi:SAM-dependent methyltransferase